MLARICKRFFVIVGVALGLGACTVILPPSPGDSGYGAVSPEDMRAPPPNAGGIYQPDYGLSLFSDRRASRVGDIVTIQLEERTTSSKSADTEIKKENDITFNEPTILGSTVSAGTYSLETGISQQRDFGGSAKSDQSNRLDGSITVSVAEVLPNGLLRVQGEKWLTLNRGDEFIRVRGLIRPEDIDATNSITSTKLADAHISYSGRGELADSNKLSWISRFFNNPIWPF
ncbi:MAG: flagellar basal body L-ring protein FlgH [Pseudomonadales bacterium]